MKIETCLGFVMLVILIFGLAVGQQTAEDCYSQTAHPAVSCGACKAL